MTSPAQPCVRGCTRRDQHLPNCQGEGCRGCLPRTAARGLQVCSTCENRVMDGLADLTDLYDALLEPSSGGMTQRVDGAGETSEPLSSSRRQARERIKGTLVTWCLVLAEDYNLTLPANTYPAIRSHVSRQAERLLASVDHADQFAHDVIGMAGEAFSLIGSAPRAKVRVACVGTTPEGARCEARVSVTNPDVDGIITCRECGEWGAQEWWIQHASPQVADHMTAQDVCDYLLAHVKVIVPTATLRKWQQRGEVLAVGKDAKGRTLFDRVAVTEVAQRRAPGLSVA